VATLATFAALAAGAAPAQAGTHFSDPSGDSGTAPDITAVDVSNDASGGVTFRIQLANYPSFHGEDSFEIDFDLDRNGNTGDNGVDASVLLDGSDDSTTLSKWDGSAWNDVTPLGTVTGAFAPNVVTFTVDNADLGGVSSFDFFVASYNGNGGKGAEDDAPGSDFWTYSFRSSLTVSSITPLLFPKTVVQSARAATTFAVSDVDVTLSDGTKVVADSFSCTATPSGAAVKQLGPCQWHLSRKARGTVQVAVTAMYAGMTRSMQIPIRILPPVRARH
jgi:hypothetical protein